LWVAARTAGLFCWMGIVEDTSHFRIAMAG
jgi:hypothetical protein